MCFNFFIFLFLLLLISLPRFCFATFIILYSVLYIDITESYKSNSQYIKGKAKKGKVKKAREEKIGKNSARGGGGEASENK